MFKYHDKDYDGVVLKIPEWFIKLNNLEPAMKQLEESLKGATLSLMLPDYSRSLYELANYKGKKEYLKREKERAERSRKSQEEHVRQMISKEKLIIDWYDMTFSSDSMSVDVNDERLENKDLYTRTGLTASAKRKIFHYLHNIPTNDEAQKWLRDHRFYAACVDMDVLEIDKHWRFHPKTPFYVNSYGYLSVRIQRLGIHYYVDAGSCYHLPIVKENKGGKEIDVLTFAGNRNDLETLYLDDYEIGSHYLIKKKK